MNWFTMLSLTQIAEYSAIIGGALTGGAWIGNYLTKKSQNHTDIELAKLDVKDHRELVRKYADTVESLSIAEKELTDVRLRLEKAILAFEMILPVLREKFKEDTALSEVLDKASQNIKRNAT